MTLTLDSKAKASMKLFSMKLKFVEANF